MSSDAPAREEDGGRKLGGSGLGVPDHPRQGVRRRDSVMCSLRSMLGEAGLPSNVRFHDLRYTAGTHALKCGRPVHEVSKMLGHADPAMTLRRYAHVLDDMRDETARAMDELF